MNIGKPETVSLNKERDSKCISRILSSERHVFPCCEPMNFLINAEIDYEGSVKY